MKSVKFFFLMKFIIYDLRRLLKIIENILIKKKIKKRRKLIHKLNRKAKGKDNIVVHCKHDNKFSNRKSLVVEY